MKNYRVVTPYKPITIKARTIEEVKERVESYHPVPKGGYTEWVASKDHPGDHFFRVYKRNGKKVSGSRILAR